MSRPRWTKGRGPAAVGDTLVKVTAPVAARVRGARSAPRRSARAPALGARLGVEVTRPSHLAVSLSPGDQGQGAMIGEVVVSGTLPSWVPESNTGRRSVLPVFFWSA